MKVAGMDVAAGYSRYGGWQGQNQEVLKGGVQVNLWGILPHAKNIVCHRGEILPYVKKIVSLFKALYICIKFPLENVSRYILVAIKG